MSRPRYLLWAVLLVTLLAFAVRAVSLDAQSLWRDEVDALCYAYQFPYLTIQALRAAPASDLHTPCACPPPPFRVSPPPTPPTTRLAQTLTGMLHQNGPLYFFLLRGWVALVGTSEYGMRFLSLLGGVLAVPLTYALGRRLFSRWTGLVAALLMGVSPYQTWYAQEVKMYTLVTALVLLALYGLRRAVEGDGRRWWAAMVLATTLAIYLHILAALVIPVLMTCFFLWWPVARRRWRGALVSLALLTLPYLPLLLWQLPQVFRVRETGFAYYPLATMGLILLGGWSVGVAGVGSPWGAWLMGGLALAGLLLWRGRGERATPVVVAVWLVFPLLAVWLISLRQPLFTDRYMIWTAPAFYLLVGSGLEVLRRRLGIWPAAAVLGIVLIVSGANVARQAAVPMKTDFRAAAAYVARRGAPLPEEWQPRYRVYLPLILAAPRPPTRELLLFQIPHGRYTFDYYFPTGDYSWADGLYTNYRDATGAYVLDRRAVASQMEGLVQGWDVIWLISSEPAMWDERGLVQGWLDENLEREDEAHFFGVDVYRYRGLK